MIETMKNNSFEDFVAEDMGFSIPRKGVYDDTGFTDDFDTDAAFEEVALYLQDNGHKVVQQRPCSEFSDYISGWTNYTKWEFTYLPEEDEWEFEWNISEQ